jgi:hypothetical protein
MLLDILNPFLIILVFYNFLMLLLELLDILITNKITIKPIKTSLLLLILFFFLCLNLL